jgi:hypothetical protein
LNGRDQKQTIGIDVVLLAQEVCKFEVSSVKPMFLEIAPIVEVDI